MSYMTDAELAALQTSGLDQKTPFAISGVSISQLSEARHYGVCTFQGKHYVYFPQNDELIRVDVVKWLGTRRKGEKQEVIPCANKQQSLWDQRNGETWDKILETYGENG